MTSANNDAESLSFFCVYKMLLSVALILLCGMGMSWICKKLKLPGLLGMLLTGIVLGPYVLNLLDENLLNI